MMKSTIITSCIMRWWISIIKHTVKKEVLDEIAKECIKMQESANNKKLSEEFDLDAKIAMVTKKLSEEFDLNDMLGMARLKEGSSYYVRGWRCSSKLRNKINAGLRSFGFGLSYNDVIAYYDNTIFGGGDEGFILTKDAIYYKYIYDSCRVPYSSIDKITSRFAGFTIYLGCKKNRCRMRF